MKHGFIPGPISAVFSETPQSSVAGFHPAHRLFGPSHFPGPTNDTTRHGQQAHFAAPDQPSRTGT